MTFYWVKFANRSAGTIEVDVSWYPITPMKTPEARERFRGDREAATEAEIRERAEPFGTVQSYERLPYPADPRLDVRSEVPSFCWNPETCAGRGSCPRPRSCCA